MKEITLHVPPGDEADGYVARWDDAATGGRTPQGDTQPGAIEGE